MRDVINLKSQGNPLPLSLVRKLAADVAPTQGDIVMQNSSGYGVVAADDTPNLIPLGISMRDQASSSTTGAAKVLLDQSWQAGFAASTIANDSFTDADMGVVGWSAGATTIGKLSNYSGDNRSMVGLVFGLDSDRPNCPRLWTGPIAFSIARAVHVAANKCVAWFTVEDGSAGATTSEIVIPSEALHGLVTSVTFTGAAIVADNTDYVTATIKRRRASDYSTALTVATYDSRAANQGAVTAFTPASFALSPTAANLNSLESDVYTLTIAKGGSGKVVTGTFRVFQRVQ